MPSWEQEATAIIKIQDMGKSGRAQRLKRAAEKLDGVLLVDINYILDNVTIKYDADKLTLVQIEKKLDLLGAQKE
jgi:copper chaperone CopZ